MGNRVEEFETPLSFVNFIERCHGVKFTLDAAASEQNKKAPSFIDSEMNTFETEWSGTVWLNPPYGKKLPKFLHRVIEVRKYCEFIAVLVPARTDTKWFHELVIPYANEIVFIKGRLNHHHPSARHNGNSPFASMVLIYKPKNHWLKFSTLEPTVNERKTTQ